MGDRVSLVCFSGVDVAPIIIPKIYSELQNDKKVKSIRGDGCISRVSNHSREMFSAYLLRGFQPVQGFS